MPKATTGSGKDAPKPRRMKRANYVADWTTADAELLRDTIAKVCFTGCAIRFGYSRDGGAFAIGILGDGDPYTLWHPGNSNPDDLLRDIFGSFE